MVDGHGDLDVVLELERIAFIGSPGLIVISDALGGMRQRGGVLSLDGSEPYCVQAARVAGLSTMCDVTATPRTPRLR